jgi:signal transduction histidine kinase
MSFSLDEDDIRRLAGALDREVLALGPEGVVLANPRAEELFRARPGGLAGRRAGELLSPAPEPAPPGGSRPILGRAAVGPGPGPLVRGSALGLAGGGQLWVLSGQASLVEMGSITAGLVHNLAGPLSTLRSTAELALRRMERLRPEEEARQVAGGLQGMVETVDRLSEAIRDLLAKLRGEAESRERELDLNQVLRREVQFMEDSLGTNPKVRRRLELAPGLPPVRGLYADFSQSFRNLLTNALQAMRCCARPELYVTSREVDDGVEVTIRDTGHGVAPEEAGRVFQPFFTTQTAGSGAVGLGLSSVRALLEPYGARLSLQSRPGRTEFRVWLPAARPGREP